MYQSALLTNVNAKRINQPTNTSRATEAYEEPEFSYNDVLYDEMSRNMKRHKRNTSNNSRNSSNINAATNLNTSSKISTFSNPLAGLSLGGTQSSNYMTSLGATNTSSNPLSKDDILDWIKRLIDEKTVVKGDADGDGKVDLNDLKVMVDRMFDDKVDIKMKNVDFDSDGKISLQDISEVIDIIIEQGKSGDKIDDLVEPDPPPKQILKGDANGDGKVNYKDSDLTRKRLSNQNINIDMEAADIDNDGEITLSDFSEINHLTKKYEDKFQTIRGDSNGDGVVNEKDYNNIKDFINNVNSSDDFVMKNSDINDDGRINSDDLQGMRDIMAGINVNYREATLRGDVDGDGKVTKADAQLISDYSNRKATSKNFYINNADFNNDGKIDEKDAKAIKDSLILKGDVNGDGKVNYKDVDALQRASINLGGKIDMEAADFDSDGEITVVDVAKATKLANEYEAKFQKIVGDSNGDGVVNEKDYANVKNYINNVNSSDDFVKKNSDINGDGNIDDKDLQGVRDVLDGFKVNYSSLTNLGDVDGDGSISVSDASFIINYASRMGNAGEDFFINNADVNKDGKIDMSDAGAIQNLLKNVHKVEREVSVYSNSELTQLTTDEVKLSSNVILLDESDNSYKVQYVTTKGIKIGWVSKDIFNPVVLKGDTNNDGKVNAKDVALMLEKLRGKNVNIDMQAVDMNDDGEFSITDVTRLNKVVLEREKEFQTIRGDSNGDGMVDDRDYNNINNFINNVKSSEEFIGKNSDINGDNQYDAKDLQGVRDVIDGFNINYSTKGIQGDVDGDGQITNNDVNMVTNYVNRQSNDREIHFNNTDVNGDGKINVQDIEAIKNLVPIPPDPPPSPFPEHISEKGIALIKRFEGLRLTAYKALPSEKYYTIGYGHYGSDVTKRMTITEEQAESLLRQDLISSENAVKNYCSHLKLNQNQFDALVSFTFNCGAGNLKKLVRNDRTIEEIAESLPYYCTAGGKVVQGLVNRRAAELELFNTPVGSTQNVQSSTSTTPQISNSLQNLINQWDGKTWKDHTYLSNVSQCKEFASFIFNELYGTGYIGSGSVSSNYYNWRLSGTPSNVYQVAEVKPTFNKNTARNAFQEMFSNAQPGDFIQIKRGSMSPHSAIFVGWTDDGIQWLDANADGKNSIKLQTYKYDDLVKTTNSGHQWNIAMSLYRKK